FQAADGIRARSVTGVQTCALPISSLIDSAQHLILPTISLVLISYAAYHMMQRTLLLDNLNADYVRTARAKGLTRGKAIRKHALRSEERRVGTGCGQSDGGARWTEE